AARSSRCEIRLSHWQNREQIAHRRERALGFYCVRRNPGKRRTMATQQGMAIAAMSRGALSGWARLVPGVLFCGVIAVAANAAAGFAPIVGAPIFAIAIGVILTNTLRGPLQIGALRVGEVSKLCLKGGIILLGASLDLGDILRTGADSLPVLLLTI